MQTILLPSQQFRRSRPYRGDSRWRGRCRVIAGPVAAAAASLLHALVLILTITAATLACLAVLAITVIVIRRTRPPTGYNRPITIPVRTQRARPIPDAPHAPPHLISRFELTPAEQARCTALGIDPDHASQIIAAILEGQHHDITGQGGEH